MMKEFKESLLVGREQFQVLNRRVRNSWMRSQANWQLNPHHPQYLEQYNKEVQRGVGAIAVATAVSLATAYEAFFGIEARSLERADKECNRIMCKENMIQMAVQKGENPQDSKIAQRPSFLSVKNILDYSNREKDRFWVNVGVGVSIPADILATLYLAYPIIRNHRRRKAFGEQ